MTGNILNFNVGAAVDLRVPRSFWTRLAGKYGNQFYWKEQVRKAQELVLPPFYDSSYVEEVFTAGRRSAL